MHKQNGNDIVFCFRREMSVVMMIGSLFASLMGCSGDPISIQDGRSNHENQDVGEETNSEDFFQIVTITENPRFGEVTQYELQFHKPMPLKQFMESNILGRMIAIGAIVELRRSTVPEERDPSLMHDTVFVESNKTQFKFKDKVVFFVSLPGAYN
jgi:hypothetical protein